MDESWASIPCRECGAPANDGEGWDGLCGNCADRYESEEAASPEERYGESLAQRVEPILQAYAKEIDEIADAPLAEQLAWLITDLRHLCDRRGLDYFVVEKEAYTSYCQDQHIAREAARAARIAGEKDD